MSENNFRHSLVIYNNFNFNAEHNGVMCIESLSLKDHGTSRQFRFTAKMLATCFECTVNTIKSRVETLVNTGDLNDVKNLTSFNVPNQNGNGAVKTTLYDLEVFNKLAMTFIDNPKAVEVRKAFSDILVKHETGIDQTVVPQTYLEALKALVASEEAKEAAQKALEAEKIQHKKDNDDFCEYVDILNQKTKECNRLTIVNNQLTDENKVLKEEKVEIVSENNGLKNELGRGREYKQVKNIPWLKDYFNAHLGNFYSNCGKVLTQLTTEMRREFLVCESSDYNVKCYHISVIEEFRRRLEAGVIFPKLKNYYKNKNYNRPLIF